MLSELLNPIYGRLIRDISRANFPESVYRYRHDLNDCHERRWPFLLYIISIAYYMQNRTTKEAAAAQKEASLVHSRREVPEQNDLQADRGSRCILYQLMGTTVELES
jgi:hypothetical protein